MIVIRRATLDDWPRMREIFRAAGQKAWPHILPDAWLERLSANDRWRDAISDESQVVLFAEDSGFSVLRHSGDQDTTNVRGEIDSFYVHPEDWGRGVGRALLAASVEALAEMGFKEATLWTAEKNYRPRRVYEAAGWTLDGASRTRTLAAQDFVELRYRIDLR